MDYLLAKISTKSGSSVRLVLSAITTFSQIIISRLLAYNDEYKLQAGEWFCIDGFSEKEYFINGLSEPFDAAGYSVISREEYNNIKYFISVQDNCKTYCFQRVLNKTRIVRQKGIRYFSDYPQLFEVENVLTINDEPDAVYKKEENKLLFKDLSRIKPIFKGIEVLFREATDTEVSNFLGIDLIEVPPEFTIDKVSIQNRRRISDALAQYNTFSNAEKQHLNDYIRTYCPDIFNREGVKIMVNSDEKLKRFIYGIDQRYYATPIRNEKRIATSVELIH